MSETYVINERVLTDDTITYHDDGTLTIIYHTFGGPWTDDEHVVTFATVADAERFTQDRYGKTLDGLVYGTEED